MVPYNPALAQQPIFCFETMLNLLYWSCFVYAHVYEQVLTFFRVCCIHYIGTMHVHLTR